MTSRLTMVFLVLAATSHADTLTLRDGASVTGNWFGIDGGRIRFQVNGAVQEYRKSDVASVTFVTDIPSQVQAHPSLPPDTPPPPPPDTQLAPDVPPPPPPADTPPSETNLKLGQTIAEVLAILGQPVRIADLGPKQIYQYKDLKITFVGGKLTDAQ
jgi:hypothetical protein